MKTTLLATVGILIYFVLLMWVVVRSKRSNTLEEYFMGGRQLPFWMLSLTFIASWWGAGSALSTADMAFTDGVSSYWIYGMPVLFSTFLMILLAKAIRRIPVLTQPQMMTMRYNRLVGVLMSIAIFLFMTITAASQMVGIGSFFVGFLGLSYEWGVILGTGIVLIYSLFGGFKGVVITDIIQFFFLGAAAIIVCWVGYQHAGGWEGIQEAALTADKPFYFDFYHNIGNNLVYVITFGAAWMIQANVWQRIMATRNDTDARKMTVMSFIVYIPLYFIAVVTGMAALALYKDMPEGGVIPGIVRDYMSPVLGVFVFVGICSAIMSTMDSLINTGAMVLTKDVYSLYINKNANDKQLIRMSMLSTAIVTCIGLLIALRIRSILDVSWIAADLLSTGCFVPLVLGFLWKRGTAAGALSSIVAGSSFSIYNLLAQFGLHLPVAWEPNSAKQVMIGMGLALVVYVIVSLLTRSDEQATKANVFIAKARNKYTDF